MKKIFSSIFVLVLIFVGVYLFLRTNTIKIVSPAGGEVVGAGQNVLIEWTDNLADDKRIVINLVPNTRKECGSFTNNGSMGTCRLWGIYTGENNGQYSWTVDLDKDPLRPITPGRYRILIRPDSDEQNEKAEMYSEFFTISR